MIFAPPTYLDIPSYRPRFEEIATNEIAARYQAIASEMIDARQRSEFLRIELMKGDIRKCLASLLHLRHNWDTYGSDAPSPASIQAAGKVAEACLGEALVPDGIVPSAEGGVALCFLKNGRYCDIEFLNSGEILAVRYSKNEDPVAWTVEKNLGAIYAAIRTISAFLSA